MTLALQVSVSAGDKLTDGDFQRDFFIPDCPGFAARWFLPREALLTGQRALPNSKEEFFKLIEILRPKLGAPIALDIAE